MGNELLHEADSVLLESGLRNYKLHHAQSMIVHWKLNEAIEDLVKHKLSLGLFKALHQDLYNMGALYILKLNNNFDKLLPMISPPHVHWAPFESTWSLFLDSLDQWTSE